MQVHTAYQPRTSSSDRRENLKSHIIFEVCAWCVTVLPLLQQIDVNRVDFIHC